MSCFCFKKKKKKIYIYIYIYIKKITYKSKVKYVDMRVFFFLEKKNHKIINLGFMNLWIESYFYSFRWIES